MYKNTVINLTPEITILDVVIDIMNFSPKFWKVCYVPKRDGGICTWNFDMYECMFLACCKVVSQKLSWVCIDTNST
jgi:hypothetical protein